MLVRLAWTISPAPALKLALAGTPAQPRQPRPFAPLQEKNIRHGNQEDPGRKVKVQVCRCQFRSNSISQVCRCHDSVNSFGHLYSVKLIILIILSICYNLVQRFRVNYFITGQYKTKGYGTITDVIQQLQDQDVAGLDPGEMTPSPSIVWLLRFWRQPSLTSLFDTVAIKSRPGKYNITIPPAGRWSNCYITIQGFYSELATTSPLSQHCLT